MGFSKGKLKIQKRVRATQGQRERDREAKVVLCINEYLEQIL